MAWNQNSEGYVINRFPICAAVHMVAARFMGYDLDVAKSLSLARAKFFAAAKNGGFRGKGSAKNAAKHSKGGVPKKTTKELSKGDAVTFCGIEVYIDAKTGKAVFGDKIIDAAMFDKEVRDKLISKVGFNGYDHLINEITDMMKKYTKEELNSSNFVYQLYVGVRDEFRKWDFFADATAQEDAA